MGSFYLSLSSNRSLVSCLKPIYGIVVVGELSCCWSILLDGRIGFCCHGLFPDDSRYWTMVKSEKETDVSLEVIHLCESLQMVLMDFFYHNLMSLTRHQFVMNCKSSAVVKGGFFQVGFLKKHCGEAMLFSDPARQSITFVIAIGEGGSLFRNNDDLQAHTVVYVGNRGKGVDDHLVFDGMPHQRFEMIERFNVQKVMFVNQVRAKTSTFGVSHVQSSLELVVRYGAGIFFDREKEVMVVDQLFVVFSQRIEVTVMSCREGCICHSDGIIDVIGANTMFIGFSFITYFLLYVSMCPRLGFLGWEFNSGGSSEDKVGKTIVMLRFFSMILKNTIDMGVKLMAFISQVNGWSGVLPWSMLGPLLGWFPSSFLLRN